MIISANDVAWHTEAGRRAGNEDACAFSIAHDGSAALLIVADGMGGHASGEVASKIAVDTVLQAYGDFSSGITREAEEFLANSLWEAHRRIRQAASQDSSKSGMGTTVVAALLLGSEVLVGHIGDSRALQFRGEAVRRLTRDHLYAIDVLGEEENRAKYHPKGNVLSQALGVEGSIVPTLNRFDLAPGDFLVLCTDGVSECVSEPLMSTALGEELLPNAASLLVEHALANGSRDNCTALIARVQPA